MRFHILLQIELGQLTGQCRCYQTCFKNENGKVGVNIYEWDLKKYCGSGWTRVCLWVDYHIRPCWRWQCRNIKDKIAGQAREWTRDTCGF